MGLIIAALFFLAIIVLINSWGILDFTEGTHLQFGEILVFSVHPYNQLMLFGFSFVGALALLFGLHILSRQEMGLSLWAVSSAMGVVLAESFLTLFLFWELLTFSVAGIIIINTARNHQLWKGIKFLYLHIIGGLFLLFGILIHFWETGSFSITDPESGLWFFLIGIGIKTAFLPVHVWVLWGYPNAQFSASVLLSGLTTKIGVYAIARILPAHPGLVLMGCAMALMGIACALLQNNLRRLLAYHIISQVGYMVAGVSLGTAMATDGGLLHVVNHMLYKALLFMSAGAAFYATKTENINVLLHSNTNNNQKPLYTLLPVGFMGALSGALAISGIPPFNGFVSKHLLKAAFEDTGIFQIMLLVASAGTALSFSKFVYLGFIKPKINIIKTLTPHMKTALALGSLATLVLGALPQILQELLPYASSVDVYSLTGVRDALLLGGLGVLIFIPASSPLEKGINLPAWFSIDHLFSRGYRRLRTFFYGALLLSRELTLEIEHLEHDHEASDNKEGDFEEIEEIKDKITIANMNFDQFLFFSILVAVIAILILFGWGL